MGHDPGVTIKEQSCILRHGVFMSIRLSQAIYIVYYYCMMPVPSRRVPYRYHTGLRSSCSPIYSFMQLSSQGTIIIVLVKGQNKF